MVSIASLAKGSDQAMDGEKNPGEPEVLKDFYLLFPFRKYPYSTRKLALQEDHGGSGS